jgi:hypothetical protein
MAMGHEARMTEEMRRCIDECLNCHRICIETVNHCLSLDGRHAEARHIRLILDCAQISATSADFMLRTSDYHTRLCGICAELCAASADSCQELGPHDATMQRCVQICRRCGDACGRMTGMAA